VAVVGGADAKAVDPIQAVSTTILKLVRVVLIFIIILLCK
jgi:uncharacterized membrane protein YadS